MTAPMQFFLDFSGAIETAGKLEQAALAGERTLAPMVDIAAHMLEAEDQLFISQGRRGGGSWKPLKSDTIYRKDSSLILVETGDLYESVTKIGSEHQILEITNTGIEFGTTRPGAIVHMTGGPKRNIPARPFIRFTAGDRQHWVDILSKHLMGAFHATAASA